MKNPKFSYMIRALCGIYLLWIVWDFVNAFLDGENLSPLMIVAAIAFAVFGIAFVITGVRGWIRVSKEQQEESEKTEQLQEQQEMKKTTSASQGMSLSERANLVKSLGKAEEDQDQEDREDKSADGH